MESNSDDKSPGKEGIAQNELNFINQAQQNLEELPFTDGVTSVHSDFADLLQYFMKQIGGNQTGITSSSDVSSISGDDISRGTTNPMMLDKKEFNFSNMAAWIEDTNSACKGKPELSTISSADLGDESGSKTNSPVKLTPAALAQLQLQYVQESQTSETEFQNLFSQLLAHSDIPLLNSNISSKMSNVDTSSSTSSSEKVKAKFRERRMNSIERNDVDKFISKLKTASAFVQDLSKSYNGLKAFFFKLSIVLRDLQSLEVRKFFENHGNVILELLEKEGQSERPFSFLAPPASLNPSPLTSRDKKKKFVPSDRVLMKAYAMKLRQIAANQESTSSNLLNAIADILPTLGSLRVWEMVIVYGDLCLQMAQHSQGTVQASPGSLDVADQAALIGLDACDPAIQEEPNLPDRIRELELLVARQDEKMKKMTTKHDKEKKDWEKVILQQLENIEKLDAENNKLRSDNTELAARNLSRVKELDDTDRNQRSQTTRHFDTNVNLEERNGSSAEDFLKLQADYQKLCLTEKALRETLKNSDKCLEETKKELEKTKAEHATVEKDKNATETLYRATKKEMLEKMGQIEALREFVKKIQTEVKEVTAQRDDSLRELQRMKEWMAGRSVIVSSDAQSSSPSSSTAPQPTRQKRANSENESEDQAKTKKTKN